MNSKFSSVRSISLDIFDLKRRHERYAQHLNKLNQIQQMKTSQKNETKKIKSITDQMHKTREVSRKFRQKEQQYKRKLEDSKMLKNILDRQQRKQYATGNQKQQIFLHSTIHQRIADQVKIESQNRKIVMHILNQQVNIKNFKKKINTQSKQYLQLKRHMNRFKTARILTQKAQKQWNSQRRLPLPNISSERSKSTKKYHKSVFSKDKITQQATGSVLTQEI